MTRPTIGLRTADTRKPNEKAPAELERALTALGMRGVGEIFVRSMTNKIHPEKIADDLSGIMRVVEKYQVPIQFPTAWSQFPGGLFYGDPVWADEVAGRHPSVPVILTKMGRSISRYFDTVMSVAMRNSYSGLTKPTAGVTRKPVPTQ